MEEDTADHSIELVVDFLGEGEGVTRTRKIRYTSKIEVAEDTEGSFGSKFKVLRFNGCL